MRKLVKKIISAVDKLLPSAEEKAAAIAREEAESQEIEYIENALDAAMMDDYSLYIYLAEDTNL